MKKSIELPHMADLRFQDILSHIGTLYRRSLLVPFIGSGMSLPACTNWQEFLLKLANEAGVEIPRAMRRRNQNVTAQDLYRLADSTVTALRFLPSKEQAEKYRRALQACDPTKKPEVPPQTFALAQSYWPLVLTTNYDDLYWCSVNQQWDRGPVVLGRKLEDCHQVLRSLDENSPPILWALQGFLGGQTCLPDEIISDSRRQQDLANQLVVGHQQYQRIINSAGHFRRVFAEVFRRRSLLFIGSGLLEDYLVNLFGEILHYHGPGPHPHFALLHEDRQKDFEPLFLQNRLGIVPVFYKDHNDVPGYLLEFSKFIRQQAEASRAGPLALAIKSDEIAFTLDLSGTKRKAASIKIRLCKSDDLPLPVGADECSVVSAGRLKTNMPVPGRYAKEEYFKDAEKEGLIESYDAGNWDALDKAPSYVFRYQDTAFFAVAARRPKLGGEKYHPRDLSIIPEAIRVALKQIDAAGFKTVHMGPIAPSPRHLSPSSPGRNQVSALHPFAQVLRGIRKFIASDKVRNINCINLYVFDPRVWYPVIAGKIHVAELLSSDLATHKVEMTDLEGNTEILAVTLRESPTVAELLKQCKVDTKRWKVEIFPHPMGKEGEPVDDDMVVAPTMSIILKPLVE